MSLGYYFSLHLGRTFHLRLQKSGQQILISALNDIGPAFQSHFTSGQFYFDRQFTQLTAIPTF
jgi:hypothetical protein